MKREMREREQVQRETEPEEEEEEESEDEETSANPLYDSAEDARKSFERIIRDKFVDGLLEVCPSFCFSWQHTKLRDSGWIMTPLTGTNDGTATVGMTKKGGSTKRKKTDLTLRRMLELTL